MKDNFLNYQAAITIKEVVGTDQENYKRAQLAIGFQLPT